MKPTEIGEYALKRIRENKQAPSRAIAKSLHQERPDLFLSVEQARRVVRYFRGSSGQENRSAVAPENYTPRIDIPESDNDTYEPFSIAPEHFPIAIASDAHFPYHSREALEIFFDEAARLGAKPFLFLGDMLDCYQLSKWCKDPTKRSFKDEAGGFKELLSRIRLAFPNAAIFYKFGNHEYRLDRYILENAPALHGMISLASVLDLQSLGIKHISQDQLIKASKLFLIHGHEYRFAISNPVNAARGLFLRAGKSVLSGHFHRTSEHTETAIDGQTTACWSIGCLCDLRPEYDRLNKWNLGFSFLFLDDDSFTVSNRRIINWRIV